MNNICELPQVSIGYIIKLEGTSYDDFILVDKSNVEYINRNLRNLKIKFILNCQDNLVYFKCTQQSFIHHLEGGEALYVYDKVNHSFRRLIIIKSLKGYKINREFFSSVENLKEYINMNYYILYIVNKDRKVILSRDSILEHLLEYFNKEDI